MRRKIFAGVSATALAGGGTTIAPASARDASQARPMARSSVTCPPGRPTPNTIQHNILGWDRSGHRGDVGQLDDVIDYYKYCFNGYPSVITLNEVCEGQGFAAKNTFEPSGYQVDFVAVQTNLEKCGLFGENGNFGNLVLSRGGDAKAQPISGAYSTDDPSQDGTRKYVCQKRKYNGNPKYLACSTHLDRHGYAPQQAGEFEDMMSLNGLAGFRPVGGGDFNADPSSIDPPASDFYTGIWDEVDHNSTNTLGNHKYDYTWLSTPTSHPRDGIVISSGVSDHDILAGFTT